MPKNETERETLALNIMMAAYGFSVTSVGALLPVFLKEFSISAALGGAVAGAQGLGGIATIFLGGTVADRIDKRLGIAVSFGAYALALLCAAFIGSYPALLALFFSIGFVTRILDALANARVADISGTDRNKRLSLLHASFGIGALIGPLYLQFASAIAGWRLALAALGTASAVLAAITLRMTGRRGRIEAAVVSGRDQGKRAMAAASVAGDRGVWLLLCAMAFYAAHQAGVSVWLPSFLIGRFGLAPAFANGSLSLYWASIVAGRLAVSRLKGDSVPRLVLVRGAAAAGAALAIALALDSVPALFIAIAFTGFASGAVIPSLISLACAAHPEASGAAASALFVTSSAVRIVVPSAIGFLMGALGGRGGFGTTSIVLGLSSVFAYAALLTFDKRRARQPDTGE